MKKKGLQVINIVNDIKMYKQMMMFIQNTLCKVFRELGNPNKYKMWDFPIVNLFNWSILMGKVRWHVNEENWDILFIGMCGFFFTSSKRDEKGILVRDTYVVKCDVLGLSLVYLCIMMTNVYKKCIESFLSS